jgi:hypothetical protein
LTEHGRFFPLAIDGATPIDPTRNVHEKPDQRQDNPADVEPMSRATALGTLLASVSPLQRALGRSRCVPRGHRAHNDATKTKGGAALRANVGGDNLDIRFHPFFG